VLKFEFAIEAIVKFVNSIKREKLSKKDWDTKNGGVLLQYRAEVNFVC